MGSTLSCASHNDDDDSKTSIDAKQRDRWKALKGPKLLKKSEFEVLGSFRETILGQIRRGKHRKTNKKVVIKEFYKSKVLASEGRIKEDAQKEFQIHAMLEDLKKHDDASRIVQLLGMYIEKDKKCLVLEYCENGDLFDLIDSVSSSTTVGESEVKKYFRHMIQGVRAMHKAGYAHMDISLENVIVDADGNAKLCDFGCVTSEKIIEEGGIPRGKINYMAPEIFSGKRYSPFSADVYSCGVVLYTMLTRRFPYRVVGDKLYRDIMEHGIARHLKLHSQHLKGGSTKDHSSVPPLAVDLLQRMICPEENRCSVEEIMNHPWLTTELPPSYSTSGMMAECDQHQESIMQI